MFTTLESQIEHKRKEHQQFDNSRLQKYKNNLIESQQVDQSRIRNKTRNEHIKIYHPKSWKKNEKEINILTTLKSKVQEKTNRKSTCGPVSTPRIKTGYGHPTCLPLSNRKSWKNNRASTF